MRGVTVIGAGLAGCEAAWQISRRGVPVRLLEMKPEKRSPAHSADTFAELVCSNSLKAERLESAAGLLKEEMRCLGSLLVETAQRCRVPAGGALAVDRTLFSEEVTARVKAHPLIEIISGECTHIPDEGIVVAATGPLTSEALSEDIIKLCGGALRFYDAAAPIVTAESLDMTRAFYGSRYERGGAEDYINCPMNREEYETFYEALIHAERAELHDMDQDIRVYEGCMPIEVMAKRGPDTIRFGPLKPVGLTDPVTGRRPWANVQLRRENSGGTLFNLVGFQTNLKFPEQQRVFRLIPALRNAEFVRYGVMHRNTFLDSPRLLSGAYALRKDARIFFAGQMTGVEGYMESAASGLLAGINAVRALEGRPPAVPPKGTMMGALAHYISDESVKVFQPMGANFGILPPLDQHIRNKKERYAALAGRAVESLCAWKQTIDEDSEVIE